MPRNYIISVQDIEICLNEISEFTKDLSSVEDLQNNKMAFRAIERNLQIIGEAVKNIPGNIRDCSPQIEWRKIAGLRDILVHTYFYVNPKLIWDIITDFAPNLLDDIKELKQKLEQGQCK